MKHIKYLLENFGPILMFYGVYHYVDLHTALLASLGYAALEVGVKLFRRQKLTMLFKVTIGITLFFGVLDLSLSAPIFFKYEAAITNILTGVLFAATLSGPKTLIQEFSEKRDPSRPMTPARVRRCRLLTFIWVGYFFLKAAAYVWISNHCSVEKALAIRTTLGTASLYGLLGFSIFLSRPFFELLEKAGFLKRTA